MDWSRTEVTIKVKGQPVRTFATLAEAAPHYKMFIWRLSLPPTLLSCNCAARPRRYRSQQHLGIRLT